MNQASIKSLERMENMSEDQLTTLLSTGIMLIGTEKLKCMDFKSSQRNSRIDEFIALLENSTQNLPGSIMEFDPTTTANCLEHYFSIFAKPVSKSRFQDILEIWPELSEGERSVELKYLLAAVTSVRLTSQHLPEIYNTMRNSHGGEYEVIVRRAKPCVSNVSEESRFAAATHQPSSGGMAFLINIANFSNSENRNGACMDAKNLICFFKELNCEIFMEDHVYVDSWTTKDLMDHLLEFQKKCDEVIPSFVFILIASHGLENVICTSNGHVLLSNDVLPLLDDYNQIHNQKGARNLKHVPKIVFINTCQEEENPRWNFWQRLMGKECETEAPSTFIRTSNLLVIKSQATGFYSWRSDFGSWAIHMFVFVSMILAHNKTLLEILNTTNKIFQNLDVKKSKIVKYGQILQVTLYGFSDFRFEIKPQ